MLTTTLSNSEYHALDAISKSGLDLIAKSPAHFKAGWQGIGADTARIGTAVHATILEGSAGMIVGPNMTREVKNRAAWDDWFAENGATSPIATAGFKAADQLPEFERQTGLVVVTQKEMDDIEQMKSSVMVTAGEFLTGGVAEASILFTYSDTDCRIRPDYMQQSEHVLVDVKSCRDASEHGFAQSCASYRYHVQNAFYATGYYEEFGHWPTFLFVAVEKTYPFHSCLYRLSDEALDNGIQLMNRDLETYKQCLNTDTWPGYQNNLDLRMPLYEKFDSYDDLSELFN